MTAVKNYEHVEQLALRSLLPLECDYLCQPLLVSVTGMECRTGVLHLSLVQCSRMWGLLMNMTRLWWWTKKKFVENGLEPEGSFQANVMAHSVACTLMVEKIIH